MYARCFSPLIILLALYLYVQDICVSLVPESPALDTALQLCLTRTEQRGGITTRDAF